MAMRALNGVGVQPAKLRSVLLLRMGARLPRESSGKQLPPREESARSGVSRVLEQVGHSMNTMVREGRLDPVIGRDREIERVIRILSRRTKNNPVLLGEPGVGKTAVVEGLTQRIVAGDVPEELRNVMIFSLDLSAMLAGTKYRGEFEERIKNALAEVRRRGNVILFIDEVHNLVGAGSAEGAVDAANLLKPALGRGELRVIGATTLEEYRKYVEKDGALARRFQPVAVEEPSPETAVEILLGLRDKYEAHHSLSITEEAIRAAVELSGRYLPERFLPDKAIDLVDEACSRARLERRACFPDLKCLESRLEQVRLEKAEAVAGEDFESAARLRDVEEDFDRQLREERCRWESTRAGETALVTREDVAAVAAEWTGIPLQRVTQGERQRLLELERALGERVVGQPEAVSAVARAIRRGRTGLKEPGRPVGSLLLLGPTGVGKTELCRALAENFFGRSDAMIRLDMSEYAEGHSASRLVGAPPGYVGHDEGGQLTERVRRSPWSLVLFDEIEKAHGDVWNLLLQIMEEGVLTDSQGRRVDFKNTIIMMTSNVGAQAILTGRGPIGFSPGGEGDRERSRVETELSRTFPPEFLNRIDETVIFRSLREEDLICIARRMLAELGGRLESLGCCLRWDESVLRELVGRGREPAYGARSLRRLICREVEDPIAQSLLERGEQGQGKLLLRVKENGLAIEWE